MRYYDLQENITRNEIAKYNDSNCATLAYYLALQLDKPVGMLEIDGEWFNHAFVMMSNIEGLDIKGLRSIADIQKEHGGDLTKVTPEELDQTTTIDGGSKAKFVTNNLIPRLLKTL